MPKLAAKRMLLFLGVAVVVVLGAGLIAFVHSRSERQGDHAQTTATPTLATGYLDVGSAAVAFIAVSSDAHGKVSGAWYIVVATGKTVTPLQGTFSGTISGDQVVLMFGGPISTTDVGMLSDGDDTLTVEVQSTNGQTVSDVYQAGTLVEYEAAVALLEQGKPAS